MLPELCQKQSINRIAPRNSANIDMVSTLGNGTSSRWREGNKMAMAHARTALIAALLFVCAATAVTDVSAFVPPTSHVLSNQPPRTAGTTGRTRLQLSTFGGGNNDQGEGYSTSNVNDSFVRSTQSSTYRPLFNGGTNSVELQTGNGKGNVGRGRSNWLKNGSGGNSFNNNFGNTYNGRTQQRNRNNNGVGGGLGNLFNFGNQSNKNRNNNNFNARQQQQRYAQPTASYRNANANGGGGFGGAGTRRTSNFSNRISDGGMGYTSGNNGASLSVGRLFRQQQKQQRQQLQRMGRYNTANSNQQFRNLVNQPSLTNNRRGGTSTGRLSDLGKSQANRQLAARNRMAEQAAQRRLRQAQSSNNGFNNRFQSNALGNSFRGVGLAGKPSRSFRLSDLGKANADRERQRRQQEAKRRQNQALATNGSNRTYGGGNRKNKSFDYDQYGRKRYTGWTAPLSIEGLFGGRNGIGSGVLKNSYKASLNARNGYGGSSGNRNYYKYNTATPNTNTAAALVNNAAFSSGRNSGGFNARGSRSSSNINSNRVRLSDVGKYDDSYRQGVGRSFRLSDIGKAPSYNAYDRFSNNNRALSWQDRMDRTYYRGNDIGGRSSSGRYYDSYDYGNGRNYGASNKNVWGGRWRGPRRDIDRRDGAIIDVDYTTREGRNAYGRGSRLLQKFSKTIVDSGAKMRLMNEIKKLERKVKNRKSQFNAEVYDIMAEIDNEYSRYGRGPMDDREIEMMDREKDARTTRAYDKARRDIDTIQDRIDRLREELYDLEDAMTETWDRRGDSFQRSLPPARRDDYYMYDRQRRRSNLSLPPSDRSRSRLSDVGKEERRTPVGSARYDDYESRDPFRAGRGIDRMRRQEDEQAWRRREEEVERQGRVQDEMRRRQDEMQNMEDERRRWQDEEDKIRFQQQRQQEEEMYRMQQARQEEQGMIYGNGDEYRRDEYDRMSPRPQDEATWTRDDELRAVNDPYRRVDPSGRPSENGRGAVPGQTSTTRRVDNRYGNSVNQWG